MTKQLIVSRLTEATGKVLLSKNEISRVLGIGKESCSSLLMGVDYLKSGNSRRYLVDDIAIKMMEVKQA